MDLSIRFPALGEFISRAAFCSRSPKIPIAAHSSSVFSKHRRSLRSRSRARLGVVATCRALNWFLSRTYTLKHGLSRRDGIARSPRGGARARTDRHPNPALNGPSQKVPWVENGRRPTSRMPMAVQQRAASGSRGRASLRFTPVRPERRDSLLHYGTVRYALEIKRRPREGCGSLTRSLSRKEDLCQADQTRVDRRLAVDLFTADPFRGAGC